MVGLHIQAESGLPFALVHSQASKEAGLGSASTLDWLHFLDWSSKGPFIMTQMNWLSVSIYKDFGDTITKQVWIYLKRRKFQVCRFMHVPKVLIIFERSSVNNSWFKTEIAHVDVFHLLYQVHAVNAEKAHREWKMVSTYKDFGGTITKQVEFI